MPRSATALFAALAVALTAGLVACGGDDGDDATSTSDTTSAATETTDGDSATETTAAAPSNPDKPTVEVPDAAPTELVVTDLTPGEGREAAAGDQVIVNYVGVTMEGEEFDNSYDRGTPFPVTLGQGLVIAGWDEGLVGAQAGMRRQLDIPAEMAYGDAPTGGQPAGALSFVIDVLAVIPPVDPATEPTVTFDPAEPVAELTITEVAAGDGAAVAVGDNIVANLILVNAASGEVVQSTWRDGQAATFPLDPDQGVFQWLIDAVDGMKIGGQRQATIPSAEAFGPQGTEDGAIPPDTDITLFIELLAAY
jgi:peptidylprolyl isomerase